MMRIVFKIIILTVIPFCSVLANIQRWDLDQRAWTPLMVYVYRDEWNKIDSILHHGGNINVQNVNGYTPLWVAIMKGDGKAAKRLLKANANPNLIDTGGLSPLITACFVNHYKVAKLLLKYGANVNYDYHGYTALMSAAGFGRPKLIRLLIAYDANLNIRREMAGITALSLAHDHFYLGHVYKRKYRILKRHGAVE